ncbi:unnamed protein product [Caenorhabditis auriculariae]|uniref:GPN-loop GTPase n=1 Tax=Caenorhabditis auriculariae TaxID=2777116 RepID=A0A8S1GSK5_9PELO|nr:unnamed protein product [Caenorhabditis auriculariae]
MESEEAGSSGASTTQPRGPDVNQPPSVLVLGMAGSGKTTFVQRLTAYLHARNTPPYVINLDPAVAQVPYPVNIDIRDTVKYKEVMKEYGLGPNGAIITCLNLMCTRFDQVISMIKKRSDQFPVCLIDTPGQIEAFTWSASGSIITDSLASSHPTVVIYDQAPIYRCFFNKADIVRPTFALRWMTDFERFDEALEDSRSSYMNDLSRSLSLVLDEFYCGLKTVCVSSLTGEGFDDVMKAVEESVEIYKKEYVPMYEKVLEGKLKIDEEEKKRRRGTAEKPLVSLSKDIEEHLAPNIEQIHLGGVDEENAEDAENLQR